MSQNADLDYSLPPWGTQGRNLTLGIVAGGGKVILQLLNSFQVRGGDRFRSSILQRENGRPLFTVCNHISTLDDPCVLSAMLPWSYFWRESEHKGVRWSLCAREICYKSPLVRNIFQNGKTLPIDRGKGIYQPIMQTAAEKAAEGDWVHVFPESKISYTGQLMAVRRGIGKLICDCVRDNPKEPIVLPFYHSGMGRVLPKGCVVPRIGQMVHVTVGHPVELSDLTAKCNCSSFNQPEVWSQISERIAESLRLLEKQTAPNWDQISHQQNEADAAAPCVQAD